MFFLPVDTGGVVDSTHQCLVLLLMVMGPEDVSKVSIKCYEI